MPALILISGAGQLGSRYLQGMKKCNLPLTIFVHDCNNRLIEFGKYVDQGLKISLSQGVLWS